MIGLTRKERMPPQPVAAGADQALSTSLLFLARRMRPSSRNSISPAEPVIFVFGAGGLVSPVVSFQMIGLAVEPTKQFLPRKGFSRWTITGICIAVPSSPARLFSETRISEAGLASSRVE